MDQDVFEFCTEYDIGEVMSAAGIPGDDSESWPDGFFSSDDEI